MTHDATAIPTTERPKLAAWLFERDINYRDAGPLFGVTPQAVRRWCLRFGSPDRCVPALDALERIHRITDGAICPVHFYPSHLNPPRSAIVGETVSPKQPGAGVR